MRLRLKFLVKCFLAIVVMLFLVPLLFKQPESEEERRSQELKKRADEHRKNIVKKDLGQQEERWRQTTPKGRENTRFFGQDERNKMVIPAGDPQVADGPAKQESIDGGKIYGPKAVFKQGELGNYEPRDYPARHGPGENGEAVFTTMDEKSAVERSVKEFGFNMVASDQIAMDRTIPDTRLAECQYWNYPDGLPTASVIIVFHNEGWSTLMRTVHSVINMSPPNLLHEIVMVDDYSDKVHLKSRLETYLLQFNGKVKLFRNKERLGLIMTRTLGARYSTGDVIVYLDAHCECNRNWLPPLLARIKYDRTIMAVPIIDGIDMNHFRVAPTYGAGEHFRGIFEWGFLYKESLVPKQELDKREQNSEPYWSPTHAGGLFAMDRKYFYELGEYDPGLMIWGGENFELSFKIWQCGGSIEWVPCSRVGHVYRNSMPYGFGKISAKIPIISINYMRVVEVWLDEEFKDYFYTREPAIRGYPIGNITDQLEFKKSHQCKSFKWFMDNIAYEVYEKFPPPSPNIGWGELKERDGTQCLDTLGQRVGSGGHIGFSGCHHYGGNQMWRLNAEGQLATGERCVDTTDGVGLTIIYCPVKPTGPWHYTEETLQLKHTVRDKCTEAMGGTRLELRPCDLNNARQLFVFNHIKSW